MLLQRANGMPENHTGTGEVLGVRKGCLDGADAVVTDHDRSFLAGYLAQGNKYEWRLGRWKDK